MNFKKIANYGWDMSASMTSRDIPHGLKPNARREKRRRNRAAHRKAKEIVMREVTSEMEES